MQPRYLNATRSSSHLNTFAIEHHPFGAARGSLSGRPPGSLRGPRAITQHQTKCSNNAETQVFE